MKEIIGAFWTISILVVVGWFLVEMISDRRAIRRMREPDGEQYRDARIFPRFGGSERDPPPYSTTYKGEPFAGRDGE